MRFHGFCFCLITMKEFEFRLKGPLMKKNASIHTASYTDSSSLAEPIYSKGTWGVSVLRGRNVAPSQDKSHLNILALKEQCVTSKRLEITTS